MSDDRFRELDKVFSDILAGISASGRTRSARLIGQEIRRSQQQRIRAQKARTELLTHNASAGSFVPSRALNLSGITKSGR